MGPLTFPPGREVVLDANAVVYSADRAEPYWSILRPMWADAAAGRIRLAGSEIVLPEVLVVPLRLGDAGMLRAYEELLSPPSMRLFPADRPTLRRAAELRASGGYGTPDAIILATAEARGAAVVTNDKKLRGFAGAEVRYLADLLP